MLGAHDTNVETHKKKIREKKIVTKFSVSLLWSFWFLLFVLVVRYLYLFVHLLALHSVFGFIHFFFVSFWAVVVFFLFDGLSLYVNNAV